jgi:uroporphyrinogen-III decarboxylase
VNNMKSGKDFSANVEELRADIEKKTGKTTDQLYDEREKRVRDAIQLRVPDRVPVSMRMTYFPAKYVGIPKSASYYDAKAWRNAIIKATLDYEPDLYQSASSYTAGPVLELLNPTQTKWPGGTLDPNLSHQAIDIECMLADEYDLFLDDPTGYSLRYLLPRAYSTLQPLTNFPEIGYRFQGFPTITPSFSGPEFLKMARAILKAGQEQDKWHKIIGNLEEDLADLGFPPHGGMGGALGAPFDVISDFYRGMKGAMLDMYRCPDKLLAACDKMLKWQVRNAVPADPKKRGNPKRLFLALHRGAEGFMSRRQFEKFYWPGLKKAMETSIDLGYAPMAFCEGKYADRLEYFLELPKGKAVVHFDQTDMIRAKDVLKDHVCIMGNVPSSILQVGSIQDVEDYCKKLIQYCGKGGGFILTNGSSLDEVNPANLKAMIDSVKKFRVD